MTELPRIQDNLYMAVNGAWQNKTVIPPDKAMVGADSDLADDIRAKLVRDLTAIAKGDKQTDAKPLQYAAKLYVKAADKAARDKAGITPVLPRLQRLESLQDLAAYREALPELLAKGYPLPLDSFVSADVHDPETNQLQLLGFDTILPDAEQYTEDNEENDEKFAAWSEMAKELLQAAGYDAATAASYVQDALAFDRRNAALQPSNEWLAVDKNWDNALSWADLASDGRNIGLTKALASMMPAAPATVNLIMPKVFAQLNDLVNEENYHQWLHMAIIRELIDDAGLLSDDLRIKGDAYDRLLYGREVALDWVKAAFYLATRFLSDPIGLYYGQTYFGEAAKQDVTNMVKDIIAQYEVQLRNNTWLSDATREKAIAKLKTMKIKMGYPDDVFAMYNTLHFDDGDDLFTAESKLADQTLAFRMSQVGKPVDRSEWGMPGYLVNACYEPTMNDITFPAGILQPPYYSLDWSRAANLGGTGATIGHEISHSFDNNGAEYDANGKMANWWTDADKAEFAKDVDAIADQFDGRDSYGAKINGRLTVSENIADNAGMAVALDLLGKDASKEELHEFFEAYTKSWATKMRPEMAQNRATTDVHAPAELRVNVPVLNFDAWYRAYDVKPGDGMYLAPDKRVNIWNK
ncbi:M13 family metallopeptidase [Lacticaseibacillus pabuli]|uniref:M13 family metallopeptidase n=1 Tax=Lacticaseibacillus pabuli TaxID=3025672 RepID=A0ABY7WW72_9LACO|nr:M13 family metallopeptidase [Lacticaseibacillus sp. KACC 23028]WDF83241.1 M13 family metallopeptidase [Lacticaseibacillus sp. KACC 23028]